MTRVRVCALLATAATNGSAHTLTSMQLVSTSHGYVLELKGDRSSYCGGCVFLPETATALVGNTVIVDIGDIEPEVCFAVGQPWYAKVRLPNVSAGRYELRVRNVDEWHPDFGGEPPTWATLNADLIPAEGVGRDGFEGPDLTAGPCNF